jgi:hypothetical protein
MGKELASSLEYTPPYSLCAESIVFIKTFVFSPAKGIDVSLGGTSLLAKTQVIIFRNMYF